MTVTPADLDLSVVVPTYQEADNLDALVRQIFTVTAASGIRAEVIVVDDDSRDGVDAKCHTLSSDYNVRLVTRTGERGLATAVIRGFQEATGKFLLVMDADLSHPPEAIPAMYRALLGGADLVMGSRYRAGGSIEPGWGLYRWLNSKVAILLARPLTSASDPLGGLFALPRAAFLEAPPLRPLGYKIALELLVRTRPRRLVEVPIRFRERRFGKSKLTTAVKWEYLLHLRRLYRVRYPLLTEMTGFLVVGGVGFVLDAAIYLGLERGLGMNHLTARVIAFLTAATNNWALNRRYTFLASRTRRPPPQWLSYLFLMSAGLLVNVGTYALLTTQVAVFAERRFPALLLGIAAGAMVNFLAARAYVFAPAEP
jgi:dolichol-phosphate mannosyltransferase